MSFTLRVAVSPDRVDAAPGDSFTTDVTVRNTGDVVEHYVIDILGLPEGSTARADPEVTKLRPGETGTASVRFTLPGKPPTAAGSYLLGVLVHSKFRQEVSRCEELPLTVAPTETVTVRVNPEMVTGRRSARYLVEVTNEGNTPQRLRLVSTDPERRVASAFKPALVDLPPTAVAHAELTVHAPRPWSREKQRVLTIEATGAGATGKANATFVQRPRFASKLARVAGGIGAVLALVGAVLGAALIVKNKVVDKPTTPAASQAPSGPAGNPPPAPTAPPSAGATAPPSAGVTAPPSAGATQPPDGGPAQPVAIDLTRPGGKPGNGVIPDDAFRDKGILVSGAPDADGPAECKDATAVAIGGEPNARVLSAARPDNPAACGFVPVMIRFVDPASAVEVQIGGAGKRRMEVHHRDLSVTFADGKLASSDDGRHGGIDFVIVRGLPADLTAEPPPAAVRSLRYTPAAKP